MGVIGTVGAGLIGVFVMNAFMPDAPPAPIGSGQVTVRAAAPAIPAAPVIPTGAALVLPGAPGAVAPTAATAGEVNGVMLAPGLDMARMGVTTAGARAMTFPGRYLSGAMMQGLIFGGASVSR